MKESYEKWYSSNLDLETEMLVIGEKGYPIILFPTSMGKYFQNKDFGLIDTIAGAVNEGLVKLYCVDSVDNFSWYNKSIHPADRVKNHIWYDKFILDEVVTKAQKETGYKKVAVAGCSFGAYHATNFAFRHPDVTGYVMNMGGSFDIKMQLDGYYDDNAYFNNPVDFIPNMDAATVSKMGVIIGVGEYDFCVDANYRLSDILSRKGINHWLDVRAGANHDWPVWREMFPDYINRMLNNEGLID